MIILLFSFSWCHSLFHMYLFWCKSCLKTFLLIVEKGNLFYIAMIVSWDSTLINWICIFRLFLINRFIAKCSSFATENLSRRKTTIITQSSTYNVNNATLANDGMDATTELKCAHTAANHSKAWLQVDLGTPFRIRNVVIYYRKEG